MSVDIVSGFDNVCVCVGDKDGERTCGLYRVAMAIALVVVDGGGGDDDDGDGAVVLFAVVLVVVVIVFLVDRRTDCGEKAA